MANPRDLEHVLMSAPVRVLFQGWESTTAQLASAGWEIAVDFDINNGEYRFLFANRTLNLMAFSGSNRYGHITDRGHRMMSDQRSRWKDGEPIFIENVSSKMEVMSYGQEFNMLADFRTIDAQPEVMNHQIIHASDLSIFKWKDKAQVDQVILDKADMGVIDHLEEILRAQKPKQKEIRERMAKDTVRKEGSIIELIKVA